MMRTLFSTMLLCFAFHSEAADRIVSTTGNASEIIVKLGKANALVAVDTTSVLPVEVMKDKPKIGYRRQLSGEGILSLNPDLIILAPDAGPVAVVEQLKDAKLPIVTLKDSQTLAGIREDISTIGDAIGAKAQAEALNQKIERDEAQLAKVLQHSGTGSALVLLNTGSQGSYALGHNSAGEHLLDILRLKNVFEAEGSKPIATEILAGTPADIIFIASRDSADRAPVITKADLSREPQLAQTIAGEHGCVYAVNILAALGFGWNTAENAKKILEMVQPCLK